MSLLLDALKKAEQEKAEKDADKSNAAEQAAESGQDNAEQAAVEKTQSDSAQQRVKFPDNDQNDLSLDDVTEFMGDGVRDEDGASAKDEQLDTPLITDDSEDLDLTEDLLRDDDIPDDVDLAKTQQQTAEGNNDASLELEPIEQELSLDELEVDDEGNITGPGGVSLDIDQFTSDLTIRRQDALRARPAGSDNYDSNLLKGSEQKVAEPTPTYTSETERAMTPEYARKMFLRKRSSNKIFYYKIYAGISLVLLLVMAVWGLFEVESRFEQIEQGLVSLKRDPMPDAMRPGNDRSAGKTFDSAKMQTDSKTKDIIARAESFPGSLNEQRPVVADVPIEEKVAETEVKSPREQDETVAAVNPGTQAVRQEQRVKDSGEQTIARQQSTQSIPSESSIQLSTKLTVEEKDRLLQQAYAAYEADNIAQARQDYDRVLELDELNRDGLLGRAAIHVFDQEYQAAIDKYQLILADNPNDSMALTSLISVANIDPKAGESQLKSLLRQQPDTAYLHFALGNMYGSQQRWSEAQNAYFNALNLQSADPDYAYNLAVSLEHLGKPQAAVTYYQRALDNSRDLRANFDRQLVRQRIGVLAR